MKIANTTDIIANLLYKSGVRYVVVSSGSRSLRMVKAVVAHEGLTTRMVVDERVAAFSALGISDCEKQPVALICTSGSAMLNYAPALAEAYYRGVPIIAITADRPIDVIDINDGQTIHQFHAIDNIVKTSIDIDATKSCSIADFDKISAAVSVALSPRKGPIHINLHLEENSTILQENVIYDKDPIAPQSLSNRFEDLSVSKFADKKILIFVGQREVDENFNLSISRITSYPNIVVVADIVSNCIVDNVITDVESIITEIKENPEIFNPDLLISMGKTAPLSRRFKEWLRSIDSYSHWRVNDKDAPEDTYSHLSKTIVGDDTAFLNYLADNIPQLEDNSTTYSASWNRVYKVAIEQKRALLATSKWSDIRAVDAILQSIPKNYAVQCSNGMTIRNVSLVGLKGYDVYCNRGVNGIDGSTSTALGFSSVSKTPTLFISGDMSALYDVSALFSGQLSPKFKMIIIANCGGEIFRMIKATRDYEYREEMLCHIPDIKWNEVAASVDMAYYEVENETQLISTFSSFFHIGDKASLLVVKTPAGNSETYNEIINKIKIAYE